MRLIIGVILIIVSGIIGWLFENKFDINIPAFYWLMGCFTGFIVMMITGRER